MELSLQTLKALVTTDFAIDMTINAVCYLIAGVIGVVIYRLFRQGDKTASVAPATVHAAERNASQTASPAPSYSSANRVQFIRFGEGGRQTRSEPTAEPVLSDSQVNRRNRSEIIRVARGMLKAGATHDNIKKVLPISEAELSLLSMNNS